MSVVAMAASLLLAASPASAADAKPVAGGSATLLISSEPTSWDNQIIQTSGGTTGFAGSAVYDGLFQIDPESGKIVPRIASSVTPNKDATEWTLKLRPNLKFTDGTALDAAAVKFNWDRFASATSRCPCRSAMNGWTWSAPDPTTFVVSTGTPLGGFPALLALTQLTSSLNAIASPAALQKFGANYGSSPETTVGAGGWSLKEWVRGDHITLVKNPGFWDAPRPYLDQMTLKPVADQAQKANALQANQADLVLLPILDASTKQLQDAKYPSYGILNDGGINAQFNVSKAPLDDVRVRRALTMALNLPDMNQKAALGTASIATTYFVKGSPFYNEKVKQPAYNLAQAQKLIDAYVAEKGPVTFTLLYTTALKSWGDAALQSWAQLKNVNVVADFQLPTVGAAKLATGDFQASVGSTPNPATYPETFYQNYSTGSTSNTQKISNPQLDAAMKDARGDVTVPARKKALDQITKIIVDQSYSSLFYRNINTWFTQKYVKGVVQKDFNTIQPTGMWFAKH
jgi:peptide/nickel transport system substrate-binding protein